MNWRQYSKLGKLLFITCSDFTYFVREEKGKHYVHTHTPILQALATVSVPVPLPYRYTLKTSVITHGYKGELDLRSTFFIWCTRA